MGKYLKAAFLNHWNLLAFGSGLAFAALSGRFDVVASLVLAAEVAYLGLLGTHPKFQAYVNAQEAKSARQRGGRQAELLMKQMLASLPRQSHERFESLRQQCIELGQLARQVHDPLRSQQPVPLEGLQSQGLDRLLWIYLRLLFTEHALAQFLGRTNIQQVESEIKRLQRQIQQLGDTSGDARREKRRRTLEDSLQTSRSRLDNINKAADNHELLQLELSRLETKIKTLSEVAINRHDPGYVTTQIDEVASSMVDTERTMQELRFATGLDSLDDAVPEMITSRQKEIAS